VVGRPHGHDGAFVVSEPTRRLNLLDPGRVVTVGGREHTIGRRKGTPERPIVMLDGVDGRELRGEALEVPRSVVEPLEAGEYLVDDLIGCEAWSGEKRIGVVGDVLLLPSADVLEIEAGPRPLLVPLVSDAVRSVDVATGRIEIDMAFLDAD
jgi:16S rRNA processing protein RimM